jgi:hypothetical protein
MQLHTVNKQEPTNKFVGGKREAVVEEGEE